MNNVSDILKNKQEVWSIGPDKFVFDAIKLMADKGVGALLVMTGDEMNGIVSERDYARKVILADKSSRTTPVKEIMTSDVITIGPGESIEFCMGVMTEKRVRHLPVVENGKIIGMLSLGDCVKAIIAEQKATIDQLESYINS